MSYLNPAGSDSFHSPANVVLSGFGGAGSRRGARTVDSLSWAMAWSGTGPTVSQPPARRRPVASTATDSWKRNGAIMEALTV